MWFGHALDPGANAGHIGNQVDFDGVAPLVFFHLRNRARPYRGIADENIESAKPLVDCIEQSPQIVSVADVGSYSRFVFQAGKRARARAVPCCGRTSVTGRLGRQRDEQRTTDPG